MDNVTFSKFSNYSMTQVSYTFLVEKNVNLTLPFNHIGEVSHWIEKKIFKWMAI